MADPITITPPEHAPDPIPPTVRVVKVTGDRGHEKYELIPNVRPLGDSWREGGPAVALLGRAVNLLEQMNSKQPTPGAPAPKPQGKPPALRRP